MKHTLPNAFACLCRRIAPAALLLLSLAQPAWAAAPFTDNGDGTVSDSTTSLVWDQCPYGLTKTTTSCDTGTALFGSWAQALDAAVAANTANYKGFNDWRIPNKNELESIVKIDAFLPAIDTTAFPDAQGGGTFWTSTTYAPSSGGVAFTVAFNHGSIIFRDTRLTFYVRLVRSGQSFDAFPPLAAQTIAFGAAPTVVVGGTGAVTTTGGGSGIARVYASTNTAACTVNSSTGVVTGVAAGTNNCTITANQAGNATYSAAAQASQTFSIGQASQVITFGAAPSVTVGGSGTVTTTGGASSIARVYASTNTAACTVNSSTGVVTGVAAGTNNCTITANQAGNANYSAAPQASLSFSIVAAPVVTPPPTPIPTPSIAQLNVTIGGVTGLPAILNMANGEGPAFMTGLVRLLSNTVGQPLQFVEQTAHGTVILRGFNGGNLAFIPYGFQTGDNRPDGIYPVGNGQYQVVRNGQQVTLAPALVSLHQLTALFPGIVASQAANGVITATLNGVTYVVQAGVGVQLDPASGTAQLVVGADGLLHFIDAQGNNQVLYPAFSEPGALRNLLRSLDLAATLSIQLDGTAAIVFNGQHYILLPNMTLLAVPADRAGQDWWQESGTRYRVTNLETYPWRVWSQGFSVSPR